MRDRFEERVRAWNVIVDEVVDAGGSLIGYGRRRNHPVVLKVLERSGNEWRSGEVVRAFDGHGMVRVYDYVDGALLLERLSPGGSLVGMTLDGRDDEATDIIADVMRRMWGATPVASGQTVHEWGKGFERYRASGDRSIAPGLVEAAQRWFDTLASTQRNPRLLHGDLHHYNVLFDSQRGWLAIDPKGVVGEAEYEIGAMLRNPYERPDLFVSRPTIERRLARLTAVLDLDFERALAWAFAQAVLSAIWSLEDGAAVDDAAPAIRLATAMRPMLARD